MHLLASAFHNLKLYDKTKFLAFNLHFEDCFIGHNIKEHFKQNRNKMTFLLVSNKYLKNDFFFTSNMQISHCHFYSEYQNSLIVKIIRLNQQKIFFETYTLNMFVKY